MSPHPFSKSWLALPVAGARHASKHAGKQQQSTGSRKIPVHCAPPTATGVKARVATMMCSSAMPCAGVDANPYCIYMLGQPIGTVALVPYLLVSLACRACTRVRLHRSSGAAWVLPGYCPRAAPLAHRE